MVARKGYKLTELGEIPEDWEIVQLDDIAKVTSGKRLPSGFFVTKYETPHPYIRVSDMQPGNVSTENIMYVPINAAEHIKQYRIYKGDLFISVAGTLGIVGKIPPELNGANLTENADRITEIRCDKGFLLYILLSPHTQSVIDSIRTVGAQPKLALGRIRKFDIPLPPTEKEQNAIATALSDADALIDALEQSIAKKRHIKQGAMQELLTGKRRLSEFTGKWANWELGKVLVVTHGKSQKFVEDPNGEYPILASGGKIGTANQFIYNKPSILIGRKGTIDKPQYMDRPFWAVDTLFYTQVNQNNIPKFIYYIFFLIPWHNYNEASGVPSLNAKTIESILVKLPPPDENGKPKEQTAIAAVLSDMDDEITALEAKLAKARQIKIGMMQELLTGRIRLV